MEFSEQVSKVTQDIYAPKAVDRILNNGTYLQHLLKDLPDVHYTPLERFKMNVSYYTQKVRWYFTLLWEALRGKHVCDTNDYDY